MKIQLVALGLLLLSFSSFAGGGWTKKKNKGYYKVGEWWIVASKHYDNLGNLDPNATTVLANTFFYGEYGITDRVTGILYFPFFSHTHINSQISGTNGMTLSEGDELNGIGDADLSVKYRLSKPKSQFAFAGSIMFGLPIGNASGGRDGALQTGDGEFNQMIRFDLSRSFSFKDFLGYANIYAGLNNRTEGFSDEFRTGGELGISYKQKIWLVGRLDVIESLQNGRDTFASSGDGTTVFANNTEFLSFTYQAAVYLTEKAGISASYGGAFGGKLILANPSYSVGVFLDIK